MRWPLCNQIMAPMLAVMLLAVLGLSAFHAIVAARRKGREIEYRIQSVARTVAGSRIPMTDSVLRQMQGLSGAEFVLLEGDGHVAARTRESWQSSDLPEIAAATNADQLRLDHSTRIVDQAYIVAALRVPPRASDGEPRILFVFYPREAYQQELRAAAWPAIGVGVPSLLVVALLAVVAAARVSRPLARLRTHVERIAEGDFRPMEVPRRNDEIRDLGVAVNQMADTLLRYEERIRQTEKLSALAQLRGGLAHQLRNSATGARIALDLHRSDCPSKDEESLTVLDRQLTLIEKYLQKFLSPNDASHRQNEIVDFDRLVRDVVPLAEPAARHAGLQLEVRMPDQPFPVHGDESGLEHLVLNLLLNAVDAAASARAERISSVDHGENLRPDVLVMVSSVDPDRLQFVVEDTGPGPPPEIADRLFEPFVTGRRDGIGLGLSVARQVAGDHQGEVHWHRVEGRTRFVVELPVVGTEARRARFASNTA